MTETKQPDRLEPTEGFDDIPGTTLFDAQRSRQGYHVNMFCMSLMKAANREEFKKDEAAYLKKWPMTRGAARGHSQARLGPHDRARRQHLFSLQVVLHRRAVVPVRRGDHDRTHPGAVCRDDAEGWPADRR